MNRIPIDVIKDAVSTYYEITADDLEGFRQFAVLHRPRRMAIYLAREAGHSFIQVGEAFGGRSRQQAYVTYAKACREIAANPHVKNETDELRRVCENPERYRGATRAHGLHGRPKRPSKPETPGQYVKRTFRPVASIGGRPTPNPDLTGALMGDPAPGRSALLQHRKGTSR